MTLRLMELFTRVFVEQPLAKPIGVLKKKKKKVMTV